MGFYFFLLLLFVGVHTSKLPPVGRVVLLNEKRFFFFFVFYWTQSICSGSERRDIERVSSEKLRAKFLFTLMENDTFYQKRFTADPRISGRQQKDFESPESSTFERFTSWTLDSKDTRRRRN